MLSINVANRLCAAVGSAVLPVCSALIVLQLSGISGVLSATQPDGVDFSADVRPILSNHCFACHGPDPVHRAADLRLDTESGLAQAVRPHDASGSILIDRIDSADPDELMPPPEHGKPLSASQRAMLRQWIDQGANYQQHWAFTSPQRPSLSEKRDGQTSIDYFVSKRLHPLGLKANAPESPQRLLRRLTLDLTGLPPTPEEVALFAADPSESAYQAAVDRLLASSRYGEHMARFWLDLVRYGDTHGLHLDNYREMWAYRDWVVQAFNDNLPFDQFITEQLAGDLLPEPTRSQLIASGFNRLNVTTSEGGSIYDEVFFRNVVDRTDAFGTVFLALTTECATCHDHKFDPISQREFYSLYAFFNSLDGRALDGNKKDHPPNLPVPTAEHERLLAEIDAELDQLQRESEGPLPTVDEAQSQWEQTLMRDRPAEWTILHPQHYRTAEESTVTLHLDEAGVLVSTGTPPPRDELTLEAPLPLQSGLQYVRLEVLTDGPGGRPGMSANGNAVLSAIELQTRSAGSDQPWLPVKIAFAEADFEQPEGKFAVSYAFDGKVATDEGWGVGGHLHPGPRTAWFATRDWLSVGEPTDLRVVLKFQSQWAGHQFSRVRVSVSDQLPEVAPEKQIQASSWQRLGPFPTESADAAHDAQHVDIQKAPQPGATVRFRDQDYVWQTDEELAAVVPSALPTLEDQLSVVWLHRQWTAPTPQSATLLLGTSDGVQVWLNGKLVGQSLGERPLRALGKEIPLEFQAGKNQIFIKVIRHRGDSWITYALRSPAIPQPHSLRALAMIPPDQRSEAETQSLRRFYRQVVCRHPDWLALQDQQAALRKQRQGTEESVPVTLVWKETAQPRTAHVMLRGEYDQPGDPVSRDVPAFLPPLPEDAPRDRLGLARWLVDPQHPLTARVAVNRFWQQLFGTGLVATSEDFGLQGQSPSHPELLDYLAVDFQESGWDVKQLMRQVVSSAAYRRSHAVNEKMLELDPHNRFFARGPRFRMDGEMLRDQALAVSGLLVEQVGGPGVKPPQPPGLWSAVGYSGSNTVRFTADEGDKIYRRSLYTFWKRTSAPPQFTTFDAPSREACTARRERTNTPLQALLLLNEVQHVQAARQLAERFFAQTNLDDQQRIDALFARVVARQPTAAERTALLTLHRDLVRHYSEDSAAVDALIGSDQPSLAAWTLVANTLLNLDEVVTK